MSASVQWAGQHEFSSWGGGHTPLSFPAIQGEQNRHAAFAAANAEVPVVGLGPSRNMHKTNPASFGDAASPLLQSG